MQWNFEGTAQFITWHRCPGRALGRECIASKDSHGPGVRVGWRVQAIDANTRALHRVFT
jgi:hypothetical protein